MQPRHRRLLLGMLAGLAAGGVVCALAMALKPMLAGSPLKSQTGWLVFPNLLGAPFLMGLTAAWIWRPLELRIGQVLLHSLSLTLLTLLGATAVLGEGVVCLLMASPLLYGMTLAGVICGWIWFRRDRDKLNLTILPLLALIVAAEPQLHTAGQSVVTDEILIHAPPAQVWPHVTSFPEINVPPGFWLFRLGLPSPMATTSAGDFVGADRRCIFSGNAVFRETVAEIVPREKLTFDIVEQPPDPELIGHLTAHRGQFELRDNRDGTTTLIGRTWYTLHVRPAWYFDWWTHHVFRAVHLRVMENVKAESEHEA